MRASPKRWESGAIADTTLLAEAATWHERIIDGPNGAVRAAFDAWRATSAEHARAYESVRSARSDAVSLAGDPALLTLRHEAVTRAMLHRGPKRAKRMVALAVLGLAGAPLAAFGISQWVQRPAERPVEEVFRTEVGQQATVMLPDGSRVTLDTASQIRIAFSGTERKVMLDGQAWFDLAGGSRPFVIDAGNRELTAADGRFNVRTDPGLVRVLAVAGQISAKPADAGGGPSVTAGAGDMLAVRGGETSLRRADNVAAITGWRDGLVQFDNVRLSDAVGELNRYRRQPIHLADAQAGALRISGSFRTAESPAFVDALTIGFPVRVQHDGSESVVIASR